MKPPLTSPFSVWRLKYVLVVATPCSCFIPDQSSCIIQSHRRSFNSMSGILNFEVAAGLCFVYLLFALICAVVNEALAGLTERRGKMLAKAIGKLVGDSAIKAEIYA